MGEVRLYRKRYIPLECVELKDDEILRRDENVIVTRWKCLKPRKDFFSGLSCYFLKKGVKVSKMVKEDGTLRCWYCDIIRTDYDPEENAYVFTDLLADVVITPDDRIKVIDLDELVAADRKGLITRDELHTSLLQLNDLLKLIDSEGFPLVKAAIEKYERK